MKLVLTAFLLPPGIFITLAAIALYFMKKRVSLAKTFLVLAIAIGWLGTTEMAGRFLSTLMIAQIKEPNTKPQDVDMLVVLTGGMDYASKDFGWLPRQESFQRLAVGYQVQQAVGSRVPLVVSGGKTAGLRHPSEAEVSYRMFDKKRAQITPTILEETSTNTYESALQVATIARQREATTLMLVTSEVHMLRALAAYRGRGIDPVPFPVITLPRGPLNLKSMLPSWRGTELTYKAMYEIVGIANYLITGKVTWDDLFYKSYETES